MKVNIKFKYLSVKEFFYMEERSAIMQEAKLCNMMITISYVSLIVLLSYSFKATCIKNFHAFILFPHEVLYKHVNFNFYLKYVKSCDLLLLNTSEQLFKIKPACKTIIPRTS